MKNNKNLMNGLRQINSLNVGKTKYFLFHKPSRKDDLALLLPRLPIKKHKVERVKSIRFLGVLLDENLSWKDHIKCVETRVAKNIGLLYRAKLFLDKNLLLTLYYSYIHTYLNYANLSWGSTNRTNLKSYSVNKSTQYELLTIKHALTIPTSFSSHKKY